MTGGAAVAIGDRSDEERLRVAVESAREGMAVFDGDLGLEYANPAFCRLYACPDLAKLSDHLSGGEAGWTRLFDPEETHRIRDQIHPVVSRSGSWCGRLSARRADGGRFTADLSFSRIVDGGYVIVVRDVTAEAAAEQALRERQELYRLLARNSTDVISLHDGEGRVVYASPSSLRLMGWDAGTLMGRRPWGSVHPDDIERVKDAFAKAREGGAASVSYRLKVKSGVWVWFESLARPVVNSDGRMLDRVQCTTRDITARKELEEQLEHQILHDPLTGLPNRSLFMDRLSQAPLRARRAGRAYGIAYLDLDRFKQVNDTLGHAAGDELLVQVARRLTEQMRDSDTLARLSGDEFAIIFENVDAGENPRQLAARLLSMFDAPFELTDTCVAVRPSIGIAIDEDAESEAESVLRSADLAMYAAKRDQDREWVARMGVGNGGSRRYQEALREALERGSLELHYQPVVSTSDGRPVALEALLRWSHGELGSVPPAEILAVARQGGFGDELTSWVMHRGLAEARDWIEADPDVRLCLNLDEDELASPDVVERLARAAAEADVPLSRLQLELRPRSLRRHVETLAALRARGVAIALDDFGIDPISLSLLARAPIDLLKIARPLVESLGDGESDHATEAVVGMGSRLGLRVTAEGVETERQASRVREMGCDTMQGFFVRRPLPPEEIRAYLANP